MAQITGEVKVTGSRDGAEMVVVKGGAKGGN